MRPQMCNVLRATLALVVTLIVLSCSEMIARSEPDKDSADADRIAAMVRNLGAKQAVERLYADSDAWNNILRNIATGRMEWLKVAVELKSGSDAGVSSMLNAATGEALAAAPANVLKIAIDGFGLQAVCGEPDIDDTRYATYEKAVRAVEERIQAVKRVDIRGLEETRDRCIDILQESIRHLNLFFDTGRDEKNSPR